MTFLFVLRGLGVGLASLVACHAAARTLSESDLSDRPSQTCPAQSSELSTVSRALQRRNLRLLEVKSADVDLDGTCDFVLRVRSSVKASEGDEIFIIDGSRKSEGLADIAPIGSAASIRLIFPEGAPPFIGLVQPSQAVHLFQWDSSAPRTSLSPFRFKSTSKGDIVPLVRDNPEAFVVRSFLARPLTEVARNQRNSLRAISKWTSVEALLPESAQANVAIAALVSQDSAWRNAASQAVLARFARAGDLASSLDDPLTLAAARTAQGLSLELQGDRRGACSAYARALVVAKSTDAARCDPLSIGRLLANDTTLRSIYVKTSRERLAALRDSPEVASEPSVEERERLDALLARLSSNIAANVSSWPAPREATSIETSRRLVEEELNRLNLQRTEEEIGTLATKKVENPNVPIRILLGNR